MCIEKYLYLRLFSLSHLRFEAKNLLLKYCFHSDSQSFSVWFHCWLLLKIEKNLRMILRNKLWLVVIATGGIISTWPLTQPTGVIWALLAILKFTNCVYYWKIKYLSISFNFIQYHSISFNHFLQMCISEHSEIPTSPGKGQNCCGRLDQKKLQEEGTVAMEKVSKLIMLFKLITLKFCN